jgi:hypothetical protein
VEQSIANVDYTNNVKISKISKLTVTLPTTVQYQLWQFSKDILINNQKKKKKKKKKTHLNNAVTFDRIEIDANARRRQQRIRLCKRKILIIITKKQKNKKKMISDLISFSQQLTEKPKHNLLNH